ncbi:hypothetical protein Nepgr_025341 [Nepenthes gracilis]|uniref:Uncharacterized protein n=1 Tax=Nepenthes gracilis TaxID=150966 RepID=A0AAD3T5Y1_NEPGR|nr:hypothetical protein Nepgr_025341 [Nepenthes gracilis]
MSMKLHLSTTDVYVLKVRCSFSPCELVLCGCVSGLVFLPSCVGVAQGSDKEDQSPLTKNGTVIHTTMVMEPLGEKFTCNDCPASGSDVSDGVNGNLISSPGQNAQWNTPSIRDFFKLELHVVS